MRFEPRRWSPIPRRFTRFSLDTSCNRGSNRNNRRSNNPAQNREPSKSAPLVPNSGTFSSVPDSVPGYYYDDYYGYYLDYNWYPGWSFGLDFIGPPPFRGGLPGRGFHDGGRPGGGPPPGGFGGGPG